uniref:Solute carrier family 22 member 11 n=1 Tax=Nomascus leucogenys TaxID=61853 RepID=A0A2I3G7E9_NOMLE
WDLVCSSQGLKPLSQSIFMSGILVGSFIWGLLSYRFGRKPMLSWCCLQLAVAGTSTIFAPTFVIYCGLRFVAAFGMAGIFLSSLTLMVEWTMTSRRAVTMTVVGCAFSAGQAALGGLAFALRDWRTLQLAASVPFFAISLISCFSLLISYYGLIFDLQSLGRDIFLLQALFGAVDFLGRATTALLLSFLGRRTIQAGSQAMAGLAILANMLVPQDLQTLRVVFAVLGKGCFGISLTCFTIYKAELFPTPVRKSTAAQGNRQEAVTVESTSL